MKNFRLTIVTVWLLALVSSALGSLLLGSSLPGSSALAETAAPAPATAAQFVQDSVNKSLAILNNTGLSKDEKDAQFRTFLLSITDLNRIADYTLGPVKRATPPEDLAAFEDAFRDYAIAAYEAQFDKFSGQTLKVVKAVALTNDITIVATKLIDPNPRSNKMPLDVDFRIFGGAGNYLVGDVTVMNIDLAITVQDQFQDFLWQHKNDVKALTAEIVRRTAKMTDRRSIAEK